MSRASDYPGAERPEGRVIPLYTLDVHVGVRRLGALALDLVILAIIQIWLSDVFGVTGATAGSPLRSTAGYTYVAAVTALGLPWLVLTAVAYFALLEALFGRTWGKLVAGLCVVDRDGRRPTLGAVLARNVLRPIDSWPFAYGIGVVGSVAALLSPRRQRLGDRVAGTLVVRAESAPLAYRPLPEVRRRLLGLVAAAGLCALFCLGFAYYGRPPLVIEGLVNTGALFGRQRIATYELGSPRWGNGTITYPVAYRPSASTVPHKICRGLVTLRWAGFFSFQGGWVLQAAENHCT